MKIRRITIDVNKFVSNFIPIRLRKTNRKNLLKAIHIPFELMRAEMQVWRDDAIRNAQVTGERMSMEWHLNDLYSLSPGTIYIETAGLSGAAAGIQATEVSSYIVAGLESSESSSYAAIGLVGEDSVFGTKTFAVYVPSSMSAEQANITSIVNTYRAAGKTFKIILY